MRPVHLAINDCLALRISIVLNPGRVCSDHLLRIRIWTIHKLSLIILQALLLIAILHSFYLGESCLTLWGLLHVLLKSRSSSAAIFEIVLVSVQQSRKWNKIFFLLYWIVWIVYCIFSCLDGPGLHLFTLRSPLHARMTIFLLVIITVLGLLSTPGSFTCSYG